MIENAATVHPMGLEQGRARMVMLGANLLMLAAVTLGALGLWRLANDLSWAGDFAIRNGLLSHWQVWIGAAAGCLYGSVQLNERIRSAFNPPVPLGRAVRFPR